ncbi:DNA polymerase III subunit chi [Desulfosoma caldarium]|uniref:DNA polymerase III chi subunit n=1 Tax=Desulfosoma caldarium TaxID=610254 RepID=A0A3N1UIZ3_9BACT|nr:DNA polymerase III subunit chi [Desulfosoma caldarium]ROQ91215.1 DNA polymerase III chi subunit [Desulfosoma caldarium]
MTPQMFFVETSIKEQRRDLCRWVERLVDEGHRVFIFTGSTVSAQQLDGLLWSFSKPSFIPHRIVTHAEKASMAMEPVLIGLDLSGRGRCGALVCDDTPDLEACTAFEIIVHFVPMDDPNKREASRRLWAKAKSRGMVVRHVPMASLARTGRSTTGRSLSP